MVNMSDRLLMMAQNIKQGETMADIGTDHGFLALYLVEKNICPKTILADISKGSLDKARKNVDEFVVHMGNENLEDRFEFRLGNGIDILEPAEVDVVCIAGMGGALIAEILNCDIRKSKSFNKLILQPRNGQIKLRRWLYENDFKIEKNLLAEEGKFICEVIIAVPARGNETAIKQKPDDFECEFPENMFEHSPKEAEEFAGRKIKADLMILESIGHRDPERSERIASHAQYLEKLLEKRRQR